MEASAFRVTSSTRHIKQHQPHPQDLPRPLALLHGIHEQDAAQSLSLLSPIDSEVIQKNAWDQVRSRGPRGRIRRHIGHANGMGIDGVEAQAGPRFIDLRGVGGDGEPGVAITLLALGGADRRRKLSWLSLPQRKSLVSFRPGSKASIR